MAAENEVRDISLFGNLINLKQDIFDAIHPIGETYTQYPQQDDPMTIYNKNGIQSVWEEQLQYNGAFFRSSNALSTVWKVDDEDGYYTINGDTVTPVKVVADNGGTITIGSATASAPRTIDGKTYKEYAVTGYSTAAAGYINKTNGLNVQGNQNLSHSHGGRTYSVAETHGSTTTSSGGESSFWTKRAAYRANLLSGWSNTWIETGAGFVSRDLPNGGDDVAGDILHINAHTHTFDHFHYLWGDGGNEARPDNFTYRIWKRIS